MLYKNPKYQILNWDREIGNRLKYYKFRRLVKEKSWFVTPSIGHLNLKSPPFIQLIHCTRIPRQGRKGVELNSKPWQ